MLCYLRHIALRILLLTTLLAGEVTGYVFNGYQAQAAGYYVTVRSNIASYGTVQAGSRTGTNFTFNYNNQTTVTFKAIPNAGYKFVSWSDGGAQTHSVTLKPADNKKTFVATFGVITYTLTVKTAKNNTTEGTVKINSGTAGATATATINMVQLLPLQPRRLPTIIL